MPARGPPSGPVPRTAPAGSGSVVGHRAGRLRAPRRPAPGTAPAGSGPAPGRLPGGDVGASGPAR
ncbi:hypothetical protein CIK06_04725 [Plantactinospora sp. KBS50]|nr:hypothetical protein CIK06_04725 [Plantactinospora sp. KBS50]